MPASPVGPERWRDLALRVWRKTLDDDVPLLASAVAFWGFLALFPTIIAALTVYGLVSDPTRIQDQLAELTEPLPEDLASVITGQLAELAAGSSSALSFGLVLSLLGALWTASTGMGNLMKAINLAYEETEKRSFFERRAIALVLTVGGIAFLLVSTTMVAVLPAVLDAVGLGSFTRLLVELARWVGLVVSFLTAVAVAYRIAPARSGPRFAWTSAGGVVATALWVLGSLGFSLYVSTFGSYGETYGALAGVVVLLLWLYLTSFVILLGAEINSVLEHRPQACVGSTT